MLRGFPVVSENDGHDDDDADFDIPPRQEYPNGIVITVIIVIGSSRAFDIITVCRYNVGKAGESK